jgi:MerR family transcriptional regulator, multidrug-efflux activator
MSYTVKVVAGISGVSIRTLHHYDEIGLLKPDHLSPSGYRLYTDSDLERLQQILFFKELGFNLREIKKIMDSPGFDKKEALLSHQRLLTEKKQRLEELIGSVEKTITAMERGIEMEKKEMFKAFDESKIEEYKKEIREKYSKETVDECEKKTAGYTKADWDSIKAESDGINRQIAALMEQSPSDARIQQLVGEFYRHINQRFYTCTPEIYRGLGDLYVSDPRFTAFYERIKPGMAEFMRDAINIYCDRL